METICYLKTLAKLVRSIRKKMRMNQVEFYNFLYPENPYTDENKKKKMNALERVKSKMVDWDLLLTLCEKCDVSADYLLGLKKDYSSYERGFVCEYTGLEEDTVKQLHKWSAAKNNGADISVVDEAFVGEEGEKEYYKASEKKEAIEFLKIINYLFREGSWFNPDHGREEPYSNLDILYSLYTMSMTKPETIKAYLSNESLEQASFLFAPHITDVTGVEVTIDCRRMLGLQNDSKIWQFIDSKQVIEQSARNRLNKSIDRLVSQLKKEDGQG